MIIVNGFQPLTVITKCSTHLGCCSSPRSASALNDKMKRCQDISNKTGPLNWLNLVLMREFDHLLNKQQFRDSIRLRCGWPVPCLPVSCSCGEGLNIQLAILCKKGGFFTWRHKKVKNITATLLPDVCKNVELEPSLFDIKWRRANDE